MPDVGEQPQHVVDVGAFEVEIDRRAVVRRPAGAQVVAGGGRAGEQREDDEQPHLV